MKHRCKKCKLEGNKGICDNEKCAGYDLGSKTPTQKDWEKRFDDEFPRCDCKNNIHPHFAESKVNRNWIKSFIRQELADARKEERMKAEVETGLKNFQVTMQEISKARKEVVDSIDPFDLAEGCVPDCTPVQHAYHRGTWDSYLKLEKILATLRKETK